jgi:hypothetical protein
MNIFLMQVAKRVLSEIELRDAFVFIGIGCASFGASQVYPPAGWITLGLALFWLGSRR